MDSQQFAKERPELLHKATFNLVAEHGLLDEFIKEFGYHDFYETKKVLGWLGY